ncbi:MAG: hypothetical protein IJ636_05415 [Bacteroidales bacterium]|nr:hypothetical protein [Bacteroidales bacterium]
MKKYRHIYSLTLADIDPGKQMTPGAVLCYFQDTIARFLSEFRVGAFDLMEEGITWMICEFHSHFERLPYWPGTARVEVFVSELSSVKVFVDFLMRDDCGTVFARGSSTWLMVDVQSRKMLPCHSVPRFTALYDEQNRVPHERYDFRSFNAEEAISSSYHTIAASETDFNGHMSNRDYVKLALGIIRPLAGPYRRIRELHAKFLQECHTGETLHCLCQQQDGRICAVLLRPDKRPVCQITTEW